LKPIADDLFSQVATGTLLQVQNKHFMLTAGHVCDQLAESNFLFPSAEGFSNLHGDVISREATGYLQERGERLEFNLVVHLFERHSALPKPKISPQMFPNAVEVICARTAKHVEAVGLIVALRPTVI
jgi:hypothetical protein